jgi:hypothetical protein
MSWHTRGWALPEFICVSFFALLLSLGQQASAQSLTNDDVIKMAQAQLADSVLIAKIKSSKCEFDTSPDALINLKRVGISNSVLQVMTERMTTPLGPAPADTAVLLPSAFGYYVLDGTEMRNLSTVAVETKVGISVGGASGGDGFGVDGFSGDPSLSIRTPKPIFIAYQQNLDVNSLHLSGLVYVATMKAYQFNMLNTNPQFFGNIYGRDYNETIQVSLWRPRADIFFHVEPAEGKPGMFRLIPNSPLQPGRYALYSGDDIHRDGMIFGTRAGRRSQGFYFSVSAAAFDSLNAASAASSPADPDAAPNTAQPVNPTIPKCTDYGSCIAAGKEALSATQWNDALVRFQKASVADSSKPEVWDLLGTTYSSKGQGKEARAMWDKALGLGGPVTFTVCHRRAFANCESGTFSLSPQEISFTPTNGQKLFSVRSSQVTTVTAHSSRLLKNASVELKIEGKTYIFDPFPAGIVCRTDVYLSCPQQGIDQQLAVANYISQTIPKLASGAIGSSAPEAD